MLGRIKFKLLTWLLNDMCARGVMHYSDADCICAKCYPAIVEIYERARKVWLGH